MKPNFALSLSSDGIRLLHRTPTRWHIVGETAFDVEDLEAALAALRSSALALEPGGLRAKVIIPDDQIRYLTLPEAAADDGAVRAALDGATPYAVEDLVYDFAAAGSVTHVAAVARETLAEAEAFATEHRLGPISFVASPPGDRFPREVWFGPAAGLTVPQSRKVRRDDLPVPAALARPAPGAVTDTAPPEAAPPETAPPEPPATPASAKTAVPKPAEDSATPEAAAPDASAAAPAEGLSADAAPAETDVTPPAPEPEASADVGPEVSPSTSTAPVTAEPEDPPQADAPAAEEGAAKPEESPEPEAPLVSQVAAETEAASEPEAAEETEVAAEPEARRPPAAPPAAEAPAEPTPTASAPAAPDTPPDTPPDTAPDRDTPRRTEPATPPAEPEPVFASRARVIRPEALGPVPPPPAVRPPPPVRGTSGTRSQGDFSHREVPAKVVPPPAAPPTGLRPGAGGKALDPDLPDASPPLAPTEHAPRPAAKPRAPGTAAPRDVPPPPVGKAAPPVPPAAPPASGPRPTIRPDMPPRLAAALSASASNARFAPPPAAVPKAEGKGKGPRGLLSALRKSPTGPANLAEAIAAPVPRPQIPPRDPASPRASLGGGPASGPAGALAGTSPKTAAEAAPAPVAAAEETSPAAAAAAASLTPPVSERDRMTVFGRRPRAAQTAPAPRKPRFLGLILTLILLAVMAAVALLTARSDGGVTGWLGFGGAEQPEVALAPGPQIGAAPEAPAASADSDPVLTFAPEAAAGDPAITMRPAPEVGAQPEAEPLPEAASTETAVPGPEAEPAPAAPDETEIAAAVPEPVPEPEPEAEPPAPAVEPVPPPAAPAVATGPIPTPEEAERFYAATGVWVRGPRLPLLPQPEALGEIGRLSDVVPVRTAAAGPVLPASGPDAVLRQQPDPPPPGTTFARDARGLILATPEGTVTPDGMILYAGSPAVVPPTRPGTVAPEPAPEPDPAAVAGEEVPVEETGVNPGGIALTDLRPPARPEDLAPAEDPAEDRAEDAPAETAAAASLVPFDGPSPPVRPGSLVPAPEPELPAYDGPRPPLRPAGLAPDPAPEPDPPEEPPVTAEEDAAAPDLNRALAAIVANAPDPLAGATAQAVPRAVRPDGRPRNFDRVVARALEQQARARPPASAPAPEEAEEDDPPVTNAAAAPTGPVPGGVATAATTQDAINLREINLIGVYGRPNDRRALVRLDNGRYVRVAVGDSLDGGQVSAIGDNALNYVRRGRTFTLQIPNG